jgi:hypothetical protein
LLFTWTAEHIVNSAVAAEREAILQLIAAERTANGHLYDGAYCLQNVAAAIRAREQQA